ncbi:J domain-containing protein [Allocoleopsis sp.]|uniref:J domain-containing protein n=1 Tax=Allocoleopsis sp. TaxID=3088169 RepID=UPI002FD1F4A5
MSHPRSIKYSRKEFTATLHLISLNGVECHIADKKLVADMKATFFKHHSAHPIEVYRVIDTTGGKDVFRGFVFSTSNGWGYIVRLKVNSFYCPFQHPETHWGAMHTCGKRSEATARTIRQSRSDWDKVNQKETPKPRVQQPVSHFSRDHQLLGLPQKFTAFQLKQAYRKLCLKHHPDMGGNAQTFREINEAYKRLQVKVQS